MFLLSLSVTERRDTYRQAIECIKPMLYYSRVVVLLVQVWFEPYNSPVEPIYDRYLRRFDCRISQFPNDNDTAHISDDDDRNASAAREDIINTQISLIST